MFGYEEELNDDLKELKKLVRKALREIKERGLILPETLKQLRRLSK